MGGCLLLYLTLLYHLIFFLRSDFVIIGIFLEKGIFKAIYYFLDILSGVTNPLLDPVRLYNVGSLSLF